MNLETKYRVVKDRWLGYEAQVKHWWFPFVWFQISQNFFLLGTNTSSTLDEALVICCHYKRGTLKRIGNQANEVWSSDNDKQFCP